MTVSHDPYVGEQASGDSAQGGAKEQAQQRVQETKDTAQQRAQDVAGTAKAEAGQVASTAKEQAQAVTSEVRQQTQRLAGDAQAQLMEHASAQRDSVAENLRSIGDELSTMADRAESSGLGVQMARSGGDFASRAAEFLENREPGELLDELRSLARRRPGAFLLGAAVAGMLVGRAARGVKSAHSSDSEPPAAPTGRAYPEPATDTGLTAEMPVVAYDEPPSPTTYTGPIADAPPTTGGGAWETGPAAGHIGETPRGSEIP